LEASHEQDAQRLFDQVVPDIAAMIDDLIIDLNTRLKNQLSRKNYQLFLTGLNYKYLTSSGKILQF
jgi:hypothetical protein|tara:strand:+ start:219 stop:416 length:198 start_codon:yes stop_codon:yes gene_type:complete